jgi:hypothetical protein
MPVAPTDHPGEGVLLKRAFLDVYRSCVQVGTRGGHYCCPYYTRADDGVTHLRVLGFSGPHLFTVSNLQSSSSRAWRPGWSQLPRSKFVILCYLRYVNRLGAAHTVFYSPSIMISRSVAG